MNKGITLKELLNIFLANKYILLILFVTLTTCQYIYSKDSIIINNVNISYIYSKETTKEFIPKDTYISEYSKIVNDSFIKSKLSRPISINWSSNPYRLTITDKNNDNEQFQVLSKKISMSVKTVDLAAIEKELPNILNNMNLHLSKYKIQVYENKKDDLKDSLYKYNFTITKDPELKSMVTQLSLEELTGKTMWIRKFNNKQINRINKFADINLTQTKNFKKIIKEIVGIIILSLVLILAGHFLRKIRA